MMRGGSMPLTTYGEWAHLGAELVADFQRTDLLTGSSPVTACGNALGGSAALVGTGLAYDAAHLVRGRPCLSCTGAATLKRTTGGVTGAAPWMFSAYMQALTFGAGNFTRAIVQGTVSGTSYQTLSFRDDIVPDRFAYSATGGGPLMTGSTSLGIPMAAPRLFQMAYDGTTVWCYLDGVWEEDSFHFSSGLTTTLNLGAGYGIDIGALAARFYGAVFYPSYDGRAHINADARVWARRFGLEVPSFVTGVGDSIMAGSAIGGNAFSYLNLAIAELNVGRYEAIGLYNHGVPNVKGSDWIIDPTLLATDVRAFKAFSRRHIVVHATGINDIRNSASAASIIEDDDELLAAWEAVGYTVVFCTILPDPGDFGPGHPMDDVRLAVNTSRRGRAHCIDFAGLDGADDGDNYPDNLHPSAAFEAGPMKDLTVTGLRPILV